MRTDEFVTEAQGQLNNLSQWLKEIESAIDEETKKLTRLQQQRQQSLDDIATRLLPDLSVGSIKNLNKVFPELINTKWVTGEINKRTKQIQQRLGEIASSYTPDAYESKIEAMDVQIGSLEMDFDEIDRGYQGFLSVAGISDLLRSGYGTPAYKITWMNRQYYRDWKRADEIVEELRVGHWSEIQSKWEIISGGYETAKQQLIAAQEEKEALRRLHDEYQSLVKSEGNVEADVLNACYLLIKSELDLRVDKSSDLVKQLVEIDERMQQCSNRINNELQDRRSKVHDQMLSLQQIIASASQSRRPEVPDEYAATIRGSGSGLYPGFAQSRQINVVDSYWRSPPVWYYDDWVIPYNHRATIIDYFGSSNRGNTYNNYYGQDSGYDRHRDVSEGRYGYVS